MVVKKNDRKSGFDYTFNSIENEDEPMAKAYRGLMKGERPSMWFFVLATLAVVIPPFAAIRDMHSFIKETKKVSFHRNFSTKFQ